MSEREIERGFRERFQQRDDDERQLQLLYEQTGKVLDPTEGVCIVLAAIPREPVTSRPLIEEADAMRFVSLSPFPELVYGNRRSLIRWESGQVRKGLRQWVIRNYDGENWAYRKFLSEDGTVAGGYRLGAVVDGDSAAYYFPVDEPNHCMAPHIESAIIDFLSLLRAYATELQTSGGYTIRAGLIGNPDEPIYIRRTENISNLLASIEYSEPIFSFQPLTVELDPLAPFDEILPIANDLARDFINQSGLRYLKVMAEPTDSEVN